MPSTTSRLGLEEPQTSDAATVLRTAIAANAAALDGAVVMASGTLSNRGTVVSSPVRGFMYDATDAGRWYLYNGTIWQPILPAQAARTVTSGSATAAAGDTIIAYPSTTITLPAAAQDARVEIIAGASVTGSTQVTVNYGTGGGAIFGSGVAGLSTFKLGAPLASVILHCDDGSNWVMVSGGQDTGWVALTATGFSTLSGAHALQYRLAGDQVSLRGAVYSTSNWYGAVTTLPSGARPSSTEWYGVSSVGSSPASLAFEITTAGVVTTADTVTANTPVSFTGLTFSIL